MAEMIKVENEEVCSSNGKSAAKDVKKEYTGQLTLLPSTIRKIDKSKCNFFSRSARNLCQKIIENYNQENKAEYYKVDLKDDPSIDKSITIIVYRQEKKMKSPCDQVFELHNESESHCVSISHLVFIITKNKSIYSLAYGNAHYVVQGLEDTAFPRNVAKHVTEQNIRKMERRELAGINYAVSQYFRLPTIPNSLHINGLVTSFQSRVRDNILDHMENLKLRNDRGARVVVSRNGVRFIKNTEVADMCAIINYLDSSSLVGGQGCDILDYITEIKIDKVKEMLETEMFDGILKDMNKTEDMPPRFDFMHRGFEAHRGEKTNFSFGFLRKKKKPIGELDSYIEAVDELKSYLKEELKEIKWRCIPAGGDKGKPRKFFSSLIVTVQLDGSEYQKSQGKWTKVTQEGKGEKVKNKDLKGTLEDILADSLLIKMGKSVLEGSSSKVTSLSLQTGLIENCSFSFEKKGKREQLSTVDDALGMLKSYLRNNLKAVPQGEKGGDRILNFFHGQVVLDEKDNKGQPVSNIYHKVDGGWFRYDQNFNERLQNSFRSLLVQKFKHGASDPICLPISWPIGKGEGYYNQKYCDHVCDSGCQYYVGDTITPYDVELFDIMKVVDNAIYLYHVKMGFGCITRDSCSQIRNSAVVINASRHGGGNQNYLKKYYELVTKYQGDDEFRIKEREKMKKIQLRDLVEWFQTRKIVYVFAFAYKVEKTKKSESKSTEKIETREEKKMKDYLEKGNLIGFSKSVIARHDLYQTNICLEELGFEFAICQINRNGEDDQGINAEVHECDTTESSQELSESAEGQSDEHSGSMKSDDEQYDASSFDMEWESAEEQSDASSHSSSESDEEQSEVSSAT